jgi:hypothetical protein
LSAPFVVVAFMPIAIEVLLKEYSKYPYFKEVKKMAALAGFFPPLHYTR